MNDELIKPRCQYCLFEQIIDTAYRKKEVLTKPIPEHHPRRLIIEELCNGDTEDCDMKRAAMRSPIDDRTAYQWDILELYKNDKSREAKQDIGWPGTLKSWTIEPNPKDSYARRFSLIWEWAKDRLTPVGAYEIIVGAPRTFRKALSLARRLAKEREKRINNI